MKPSSPRKCHILVAEDNPADIELLQIAFDESDVSDRVELHIVKDGEEVIAFLRKYPPFESVPMPNLILLDLNMPRKTGYEVLDEISQDPQLKTIPVVVLTHAATTSDFRTAHNGDLKIMQKPTGLSGLHDMVEKISKAFRQPPV